MKTIAGVFDSELTADRAIASLLDEGFRKDDISLIVSDDARHSLFSKTDDEANRVAKGGALGAATGGVLGGLVAGLTSVGAIAVSGGGLLAVGPMVAILSGVGAGGTVGGLGGALISAGFAADDANRYEEELKRGKAIVLVHTTEEKAHLARSALTVSGATVKAA